MIEERQLELIHPRIAALLAGANVAFRVHAHETFAQPIGSAEDFAAALDVDAEQITKTLLLIENHHSPRMLLACCPAPLRVDLQTLASQCNYRRLQMASPDDLARTLDFPRHGVSPLAAPADIPVFMHADLLGHASVWIGAGRAGVEIELAPADLQHLAGADVFGAVSRH